MQGDLGESMGDSTAVAQEIEHRRGHRDRRRDRAAPVLPPAQGAHARRLLHVRGRRDPGAPVARRARPLRRRRPALRGRPRLGLTRRDVHPLETARRVPATSTPELLLPDSDASAFPRRQRHRQDPDDPASSRGGEPYDAIVDRLRHLGRVGRQGAHREGPQDARPGARPQRRARGRLRHRAPDALGDAVPRARRPPPRRGAPVPPDEGRPLQREHGPLVRRRRRPPLRDRRGRRRRRVPVGPRLPPRRALDHVGPPDVPAVATWTSRPTSATAAARAGPSATPTSSRGTPTSSGSPGISGERAGSPAAPRQRVPAGHAADGRRAARPPVDRRRPTTAAR